MSNSNDSIVLWANNIRVIVGIERFRGQDFQTNHRFQWLIV